jgi:hypothetical protein
VKAGVNIHIYPYTSVANLATVAPWQTIVLEDGGHVTEKTSFVNFGDTVILLNAAMPLIYLKILGNAFVIDRDSIYIRDFNEAVPTTDSVVSKSGYAYKCIRSHFPEDPKTVPGTGVDWRKYWVLLGPKVDETAWDATNAGTYSYCFVLSGGGLAYYYRALQETTNNPPAQNNYSNAYWQFVGYANPISPVEVLAWNSATTYAAPGSSSLSTVFVSKEITYGGVAYYEEYLSLQESATSNPGVTENWQDYWQYLGVYETTTYPAWVADSGELAATFVYKSNIKDTIKIQDNKSGFPVGCFASGRLWLAGNTDNRNSVYISQSIVNGTEFNRMYQLSDPYSTVDSEIVDTDGAVVIITEASVIKSIIPYNFGVLVFAENGVWYIGGSDGFRTTLISIQKVSDVGVQSSGSVASVESGIVFFGKNGVYGIKESVSGSGNPDAQDIGVKIQSYYVSISATQHAGANSIFDSVNKRLYYFYNYPHTNCLVLDTRTGSWFKHEISGTVSAAITHFVQTPNATTESSLIFLMSQSDDTWGFGKFTPTVWSDFTGTSAEKKTYESYITMAHQTYGTVMRKREATYLTTVFERLEPTYDGSCKMRVDWNWARTSASPYFGMARQVYFPNKYITSLYNDTLNGLETVVTKHKIRGWGNVFRFHFESEGDMPFKLLGWELLVAVDPTP